MVCDGKFVIKRGHGGKTHFVLLASNGRAVATSETYESKESCLKGHRGREASSRVLKIG